MSPEDQTPGPITPPSTTTPSPAPPLAGAPQPGPVAKKPINKILLIIPAVLLVLFGVLIGYILMQPKPAAPAKQASQQKKSVIKIAVNPWQASELNATIAKIILEEKMGYSVELVEIDEMTQWQSLAKGDIDASLEVWPSGHKANIQKFIKTDKSVEDGGSLGPIGKIGWYIPKYLLNEHPTLATWEGFKDPQNVALFTASASAKGQFYTGDPTWTQYDDQIIKNLGLNFEVQTLGSEEALLKVVNEAYTQKQPIVFYFWTPHWAHAIYDLAPVELPAYSDACYKDTKSGVNCDYPKDQLLKVFSASLKDESPEVYQFLRKFNYTNEDQIRMLAALQQKKQTPEEVARNWISNNEAVWQLWIP